MDHKEEPNYYAIIPANVRYDKRLIQGSKLLYGEITALSNQKGYCWASNNYFMKLYEVSRFTIQAWLKSLEDCGYINRQVIYKEGSKEIQARYIGITSYPSQEKLATPSKENLTVNNTSFNTTVNNTNNIKPLSGKPDPIPYKKIIGYLNEKTGRTFRNVESNKKLIKARWHEGYQLDDFKKVIDNKVIDANDSKSYFDGKFLQPSTLFGSKFDQYLNQTNAIKQKGGSYGGVEF
ncbi:conserved phage C-terminal domain-containing protein [Latilactobacillus curvatus]|uniref:conserved phage C-terminal domain-containing protein n=1 Tax=Latilactobacillus curvatus TaxID=28038 RepID=UPI0020C829FA|nr:conserved phage C-terminal domain-containing protein [Latilactobacillus curvatus]MCP8876539.1 conserved phage C-terminal domain-containing protein [Latilactobacillus curvatus]